MTDLPSVTVIIPTKNRPDALSACLERLARQDYPRQRWNVVVVNDGGDDPSRPTNESASVSLPFALISIPARGPAAARNRGARDSEADLFAFLDDDCQAEPSWLREMASGIASSPYQACLGRTLNLFPALWPARAYQFFMEFYRDYARLPGGDLYLVMSNNAIYRREVFAELGGFNENFPRPGAEDLELSHRLVAGGFRQGYLPQAIVRHAHCQTVGAYLRQQYQYGRGYARMAAGLRRSGIPLRVGQRRRPQFHLVLLRTMLQKGPGLREGVLIWCGILAHSTGMRSRIIPPQARASRPAGDSA
jgi:glycosyltransferase involved in cell wall biosynthesis